MSILWPFLQGIFSAIRMCVGAYCHLIMRDTPLNKGTCIAEETEQMYLCLPSIYSGIHDKDQRGVRKPSVDLIHCARHETDVFFFETSHPEWVRCAQLGLQRYFVWIRLDDLNSQDATVKSTTNSTDKFD
jgi:hypothetical protein